MKHLLIGLCIFTPLAHAYDMVVTEAQIQTTLNDRLPFARQSQFMTLTIERADIDLLGNGSRVGMVNDFILTTTVGLQSRGTITAEGDVRFNDAEDSFYIDNPQVVDVDIEGIPAMYRNSVIKLAQQTLAPAISGQPVYTLTDDGEQKLAKMLLKEMTISEDDVTLIFSPF